MRFFVLIFCYFLFSIQSHSQRIWTLRECIDFATEHNVDIMQQDLQVKSAEVDLNTAKSSRLPDLNSNASQSFNFGRSPIYSTNTYEQVNSSSTQFSISSSTPIFTGFRIKNQIKSDEYSLKAAIAGLDKVKDNMELQITTYYLDVLFKKEILQVYKEQAALTNKQVNKTQILYDNGKVAMSQVYDIKAQLAKDELNVTNAQNDLDLSLLTLSQALNLKTSVGFDIQVPNLSDIKISDKFLSTLMSSDEVYQKALVVKPHIKEAIYKIETSKYNLKVAQAGYWPTLSFDISYSNGFNHIYKDEIGNDKISDQLKNNYRTVLGVSLSIPIFNRFETRNQVRKSRLEIQNQEYNLVNVKLAMYKEIQQAYQNAVAAEAKYVSTENAYLAAAESFKYAEDRYQVGKSTVFEYSEAQTKLVTSQSEQIQAKYDFVFRSKILDFYQGKEIEI